MGIRFGAMACALVAGVLFAGAGGSAAAGGASAEAQLRAQAVLQARQQARTQETVSGIPWHVLDTAPATTQHVSQPAWPALERSSDGHGTPRIGQTPRITHGRKTSLVSIRGGPLEGAPGGWKGPPRPPFLRPGALTAVDSEGSAAGGTTGGPQLGQGGAAGRQGFEGHVRAGTGPMRPRHVGVLPGRENKPLPSCSDPQDPRERCRLALARRADLDHPELSPWLRWVGDSVHALPYAYETPIRYRWDELNETSPQLSSMDVVLMTQASPERLPFVRRAISLFDGPCAIAVYIPFPHTHPSASLCRQRVLGYMVNTIKLMRGRGGPRSPPVAVTLVYANTPSPTIHCSLWEGSDGMDDPWVDVDVWREHVQGKQYMDIYNAEYPVGTMRQLSFDLVPDDRFVFMADADFVFPAQFATHLTSGVRRGLLLGMWDRWRRHRARQALIIPAFERSDEAAEPGQRAQCSEHWSTLGGDAEAPCWLYAGGLDVPATKAHLRRLVASGRVIPFYESRYAPGHNCYFPRHALRVDAAYDIPYLYKCEPYIVGLKAALPAFDERWRGRLLNKINYLTHAWAWGTRFTVEPTSFMVHLPHAETAALMAGHPELTEGMQRQQNLALQLPYLLSRVFLAEVAAQRETARAGQVARVRRLNRDPGRGWAAARSRGGPSPWRSGLPYAVALGPQLTDAALAA